MVTSEIMRSPISATIFSRFRRAQEDIHTLPSHRAASVAKKKGSRSPEPILPNLTTPLPGLRLQNIIQRIRSHLIRCPYGVCINVCCGGGLRVAGSVRHGSKRNPRSNQERNICMPERMYRNLRQSFLSLFPW